MDVTAGAVALQRLEDGLDPAHPERSGVQVLAYGEISAALLVPREPALADVVVKRMSGFADDAAATKYVELLREYLERLSGLGITTLPTEPVIVTRRGRGPTVYLMQPRVAADDLGNRVLFDASDDELAAAVTAVLVEVGKVLERNAAVLRQSGPADEISIDAQLSNWAFHGEVPVLIDVGTPFIRREGSIRGSGGHAFDQEILLSAVPPGIRHYYRRKGTASEYMDDYFDARLIAVDLLGNFIKEGAAERLPVGIAAVNEWLRGAGSDLPSGVGTRPDVTRPEVEEYYEKDAATLALFLRVRRMDRQIRHLLRRPYDFILPGPVRR